ncbi:MAG: hypothetical protein AUG87_15095 [Candidatus Rokubacteria bacterium 13_1_20CM_4_70_14]|nr:MAG: hypothetical protein AUG87_15095 [Candidatus Rokubacteria bacterium 13_1_20CM_4_70_14]
MPTDVIMPALEMAQETGKVLKWLKAPGHAVRKGEPIVEIETDKVTVEIEAPASGVLRDVTARATGRRRVSPPRRRRRADWRPSAGSTSARSAARAPAAPSSRGTLSRRRSPWPRASAPSGASWPSA